MPELEAVTKPKQAIMSYSHNRNQDRIKKEEEELEELMKKYSGKPEVEDEEDQETEQEGQEEKLEEEQQEEPTQKLSKEEETFKKRYGDLRRHAAKEKEKLEARIAELENRKESQSFALPKTKKEIEAWAKKYPDVAGIVEAIAKEKADEMFSKANERFERLDELTFESKIAQAESEIRQVHKDFDKLREDDKFHSWVESQPKWIQDALYENTEDSKAVIRVIDLYKADNGLTPKAKKERAKEAAADVKAGGVRPDIDADESSKKIKESEIAKMSAREYAKNEEKILKAMREGNIIYDITKK